MGYLGRSRLRRARIDAFWCRLRWVVIKQAGNDGTKVFLRMRRFLLSSQFTSPDRLMKFLKILALSLALLVTAQAVQKPSAHTY
jgi:hypothetical protein